METHKSKLMICPKAKECGIKCKYQNHQKEHDYSVFCDPCRGCPACVPSQSVKPDGLLSDEEINKFWDKEPTATKLDSFVEEVLDICRNIAKAQRDLTLSQCQQAKQERIGEIFKELKKYIGYWESPLYYTCHIPQKQFEALKAKYSKGGK